MEHAEEETLINAIKTRVQNPKRATLMAEEFDYPATINPPASLEQIELTEQALGLRLPRLIRELYMQVGNGGFGPGYGIIGLPGGTPIYGLSLVEFTLQSRVLEEKYEEMGLEKSDLAGWAWKDNYIPYAYWGCNVVTVVDCDHPRLPVYALDALVIGPHSSNTLDGWWVDWLNGTIKQY